MNLSKSTLVMIALFGAVVATPTIASPLFNGDFELPAGTPNTFIPVGASIPGWTVVGTGNVDQVNSGTLYWPGNTSQFMDLTGNTGGAGIQSDPFATTIGQTYQITFDAFNGSLIFPGTAYTGLALSVQASGSAVVNYDGTTDLPAGVPEVLTYSFTANATSTTLTFLDLSQMDSNAGWIDNITITSVPEPSTTIIFGALLVPFCVRLARKHRVA